ncbi:MAG: hypothetical protein KGH63_01735 [Candidatus Micrarchaeota archaeon]|nr:hypothetical protein [Candidatus Micrarchaeota archaeon]
MLSSLAKKPLWFKLQLLATLALIIPVWFFTYLPLNDWPNHLASMHLLVEYDAGIPTYIQPNPSLLLPNASVFYFMRALGPFVGVETAGRMLLTLYLLLMPWAMGYLLRQFHPSLEPLGLASAALSYNWFFSMGFLNYVLSLPLFLLCAAYWMEHRGQMKKKKPFLIAAALFTLTFLTHLVAGGILALFIFFIRLRDEMNAPAQKTTSKPAVRPRASAPRRVPPRPAPGLVPAIAPRLRSLVLALLPDVAAFLPCIAIAFLSMPSILSGESASGILWSSWWDKLQYLQVILPAPIYTIFGLLVIAMVVVLSVEPRRLLAGPEPFMAALALLLLLGAVTLPESTASWQFAAPRLLPFFLFAAIIALAWPLAHPAQSPLLSLDLPIALFLLVLVQVAWLWMAWSALQAPMGSFVHLSDQMPAHAYVWPLGSGMATTDPQLHASPYFQAFGYWVVKKDVFVPGLFDAAYSPLQYTSASRPARDLVENWLNDLVSSQFANRTASCGSWDAYYSSINWSLVGAQFDYVAMRKGSCDNLSSIPGNFPLVYSQSPLYLYKTNRSG